MKRKVLASMLVMFFSLLTSACGKNFFATPKSTYTPALISTNTSLPIYTATFTSTPLSTKTPIPPTLTQTPDLSDPQIRCETRPQATITAPPLRISPIVLPGGLKIEEYPYDRYANCWNQIENRLQERGQNLSYGDDNKQVYVKDFSNGLINVQSQQINEDKWTVVVNYENKKVFETTTANLVNISGFVKAWIYNNHWALEIIPYPYSEEATADVILDGISLRQVNGYKEVFGFQTLAGKPFYFYKTKDGVGISYNGQNSGILYDDVRYRNHLLWRGFDPDPIPYENMVKFFGIYQDKQFEVVIGLFD